MWAAVSGALLAPYSGRYQQGNEGESKGHALYQWTASRDTQSKSFVFVIKLKKLLVSYYG